MVGKSPDQRVLDRRNGSAAMDITRFLTDKQVPFEQLQHLDTYDAQRLAQTLHVPGHEVAKTVLLRANGGYTYVVAILPAPQRVDLSRLSAALGGSRLAFATEIEIADHCPDCEVGVLPPFGSQYGMRTVVDTSLAEDEEIVFAGTTQRDAIRVRCPDFGRIEQPLIVPFAHS
jgi:Ala-tRNA(Pro) deacylase